MTLKDQLNEDVKNAMRSKDVETRDTLRLLLAAIKQEEVDKQIILDDADVLAVINKQAKQRRESIEDYTKANRPDLVGEEERQLIIIERYLPQMMSREEIEALAQAIITQTGVTDAKGMGQVMGQLMPKVKGKADGRLVNEVVRDLLNN
jgi:uncharacterized protein